jgi:hypothetical protein
VGKFQEDESLLVHALPSEGQTYASVSVVNNGLAKHIKEEGKEGRSIRRYFPWNMTTRREMTAKMGIMGRMY